MSETEIKVREYEPVAYHVMPVPVGMSPEQAWETHSRGELLPDDPHCDWVVFEVEGGEYQTIDGAEFLIGGRLRRCWLGS